MSDAGRGTLHIRGAVGGASPQEGSNPTYQSPTKKQVNEEDAHRVALVLADDGGEKIQRSKYQEGDHSHTSLLRRIAKDILASVFPRYAGSLGIVPIA